MKHIQFNISIDEKYQEPLIAELEEMGFEGYQQHGDEVIAYILQKDLQIGNRQRIDQLLAAYPGDIFIQTEKIVAEKNWNREWEKTIEAVAVGDFLIKPTWSTQAAEENQLLLQIDPQMSFGTGYHATTRLMLKMLSNVSVSGKKVLDAGTGTGILAIAVAKMGAKNVVAFDTDEWSIQNAEENVWLNEVAAQIEVRKGSVETLEPDESFDMILANINKNTIFGFLPVLNDHLKEEGRLLLSGMLGEDEKDIKRELNNNHLSLTETKKEKEWLGVCARKI